VVAEQAEPAERGAMLKKAKLACRRALKQCRLDRAALPSAYRLQGTYEWLRGKPEAAQKRWQHSVALAEELGARHDLGRAHLEMGTRMGNPVFLQQAEAIFRDIGANWNLAQVQELITVRGIH
jgi:hypothetical protein